MLVTSCFSQLWNHLLWQEGSRCAEALAAQGTLGTGSICFCQEQPGGCCRAGLDHQGHTQLGKVATKHTPWHWERFFHWPPWRTQLWGHLPSLVRKPSSKSGPAPSSTQLVSPYSQPSLQTFLHLRGSTCPSRFLLECLWGKSNFPKPSGWQVHVSAWTTQPRRVSAMVSQEGVGNNWHKMSQAKQMK